jgi:hypothetical protein
LSEGGVIIPTRRSDHLERLVVETLFCEQAKVDAKTEPEI